MWFVFCYFVAFIVLHSLILILAAVELGRYKSRGRTTNLRVTLRSPLAPSISVLVPAYNEASGIVDSVRSLLALDYPQYEIIVVNDGSTDATCERLIETFGLRAVQRPVPPFLSHKPVRALYAPRSRLKLLVIDKENGGKADALNAGINFASCDLVCSVDADSILEQDALAKTALPFIEDPDRTIGTGGMVRVANGCRVDHGRVLDVALPRSRFAMFQVVEYVRAFFAARTGWTAMNALLIVSGAFGLFRRDVIIAAGGYRVGTVAEDLEIVLRLHRTCRETGRPYRILYVPDPVCWTEAPESARYLRRQRRRWHRGCVEMLFFHRRMLFNPRYRAVGLAALPSMLIFDVLGPVIELSGYAVSIAALVLGTIGPGTFALFLAMAVLYGLIVTLGAIRLEDTTANRFPGWEDLRRVLLYALGENCGYRQLLHVWRIEGFWQLLRKPEWGAMERKGFAPPTPLAATVGGAGDGTEARSGPGSARR
jgi:cellulose synthase/poly-beta-1,6-N-acetylglucosamine synthase-like glycosyltransferase